MRKKKESSIKLHKEYGLNPTMPLCPICGKERGEIALLGAAYKEKAPMHMVIDNAPCNVCANALQNDAVIFIEVRDGETGDNPWRTGYICAIRLEAAKRIFQDMDWAKHRVVFIEQKTLKIILGTRYGEIKHG